MKKNTLINRTQLNVEYTPHKFNFHPKKTKKKEEKQIL